MEQSEQEHEATSSKENGQKNEAPSASIRIPPSKRSWFCLLHDQEVLSWMTNQAHTHPERKKE